MGYSECLHKVWELLLSGFFVTGGVVRCRYGRFIASSVCGELRWQSLCFRLVIHTAITVTDGTVRCRVERRPCLWVVGLCLERTPCASWPWKRLCVCFSLHSDWLPSTRYKYLCCKYVRPNRYWCWWSGTKHLQTYFCLHTTKWNSWV